MQDAIAQAAALKPHNQSSPIAGSVIPTPVENRTVHVDGDYLAYFCGAVADSPGYARSMVHEYINNFKLFSGSTKAYVHLTGQYSSKGDRSIVAAVKAYQANRSGASKPEQWQFLRDYLTTYSGTSFEVKIWDDREADDGVAFYCNANPDDAIATRDKDFRMIPGHHIDWKTLEVFHVPYNTYEIVDDNGKVFGHKWFWLQMLQGDTADNIPGLESYTDDNGKTKRCGEKTAESLLEGTKNNKEAFDIVYGLYRNGYGEEAALRFCEQAVLLWMRTDEKAQLDDFFSIIPKLTMEEEYSFHIAMGHSPRYGDSALDQAFSKIYNHVEDTKDEAKNYASETSTNSDAERTEW